MATAEIVFLGYFLSSCNMKRQVRILPKKISVKITNFNLNELTKQFSLLYEINLISDSEEVSTVSYEAYFYCDNDRLCAEFKKLVGENGTTVFSQDSELKKAITSMVQLSFPYIRQALSSMTNDIGGSITMPIIDSRVLITSGLEFNRIDNPVQTKQVKKPKKKKQKSENKK